MKTSFAKHVYYFCIYIFGRMAKEKFRNIGTILLSVVYYLGVIVATSGPFATPENQYSSDANTKNQTCFSSITTNLYCPAPGTEKLTNDSTHEPVINLKNWGNPFFVIIYADGILFRSKFSQYTRHATFFLIRYRKADIIFPFHYFW